MAYTTLFLIFFFIYYTNFIYAVSKGSEQAVLIPGDLLLGGLFPIHDQDQKGDCSDKVNVDGIMILEAFLYSLDMVNIELRNEYGFQLGAIALDTCSSERVALFNALKFVIRDYNKRRDKDEEITIDESELYDTATVRPAIEVDGLDIIGVVGPAHSSVTLQVANLFNLFKMPQVCYAATTSTLSNRDTFPYFLRTVPSDNNQARVLLEILKAWNWSYVIGAYEDSNYGTQGFHEFEKVIENSEICLADRWKLSEHVKMNEIRNKLRKLATGAKEARAFVLYMATNLFQMVIRAAIAEGLENRFIWIGTDGWGNRFIPKDIRGALEGAIVSMPVQKAFEKFSIYFYSLQSQSNKRNVWFKEFWNKLFNCNDETKECLRKGTLKNVIKQSRFSSLHNVRDSVFAFSTALQRMHDHACQGPGICDRMKRWLADPDRQFLLHYLRNSTFLGIDGVEFFFDGQDGVPNYTILNYQQTSSSIESEDEYEWVTIGSVKAELEAGESDQFRFDHIQTDHRYHRPLFKQSTIFPSSICGRPCPSGFIRRYKQNKCCWSCERCPFPTYRVNESQCDPCPILDIDTSSPTFFRPSTTLDSCEMIKPNFAHYFHNIVVALVAASSAIGLFLIACTFSLFLYYSQTPIIKASGRELSIVLLSGISLCYCNVFVVASAPNPYTCAFSRFLYSTGYTICYASIFIKTNRIARIFRPNHLHIPFIRRGSSSVITKRTSAIGTTRTKYIGPLSQVLFVLGLVGFQTVINIIWLILRPPSPTFKLHHDYERREVILYKFCRAFENEDMIIALLFPVTLLLLASFYAFKTRKCPGKFNEMKYIVITTYTTCIVWLAFIPMFFATEQLNLRIYAMCASLCINATVTLVCMFAPKLFVAIYRPQKNTKDAVMGKKERNSYLQPNSSSPYNSECSHCDTWPTLNHFKFSSAKSSMVSAGNCDKENSSCAEPLLWKNEMNKMSEMQDAQNGDLLTVPRSNYYVLKPEQNKRKQADTVQAGTYFRPNVSDRKLSMMRKKGDRRKSL